jgi:DNA-binding NarL/FixJ family response regulator
MPAACKWIEQLYSGLETADTAKHSPDIPVSKNETVIGEASEGLRRLFAFAQAKHDEAIKLITDTALSPREVQVATLLAEGKTTPAIAAELHISPSTVDVHRRNLMRKLGLHSVVELTRYAIRSGLVLP